MAHYGTHPSLARQERPSDDVVWHWFVCNGPHGERFRWVDPVLKEGGDLPLLRRFIAECAQGVPEFEANARAIAVEALKDPDRALVLKGIHVLAAIGTDDEMGHVIPLACSEDTEIRKHARTALFERGIKMRKQ